MRDMDPRPTREDLIQVVREVLPAAPNHLGRHLRRAGTAAAVRGVALIVAIAALPGVGFPGEGNPPLGSLLLVTVLAAGVGAAWEPTWRHLAGRLRGFVFGATVTVLDLALLRLIDVLLGERFQTDAAGELFTAALLLAVPTAVAAVVVDVVDDPDGFGLPD